MNIKYLEEIERIYNRYIVDEKDTIDGTLMSVKRIKYPTEINERYNFFKEYTALIRLEYEKNLFEEHYHKWDESKVKSELKEIDNFINSAENIELSTIYKEVDFTNTHHEYIRLKNNDYLNIGINDGMLDVLSLSAKIYARYFLFKDFLETLIKIPITVNNRKYEVQILSKLEPIQELFIEKNGLQNATDALNEFFENHALKEEVKVNLKNKSIGVLSKALGDIWIDINRNDMITIGYLSFCKALFPIYKKQDTESKKITLTNMYKYFLAGDK